jgi:hypothetical protein
MDGFLYDDDVENEQKSVRRLALTEASLNRTLLHDETKHLRNKYSFLMYIFAGSIIVFVIILLIIAYKHLI